MGLSKKTKRIGMWVGIVFAIITIIIGILFITNVITFQITGKFFGWFLIILAVGMGAEYFITKGYKLYKLC